jgi:DNA-binding GntR family transcriptional regulator
VTTLTVEEVEQLFQMRAALEGVAARRAAKIINAGQKAKLRTIIQQMGQVANSPYAWLKFHDDFHELLCAISGWDRLAAEIRKIRSAVHPYLLLYNNVYHETEMRGADHTGLLLAIETGNEILAQTVASDHVLSAGTGVVEWLKSRPD